MQTQIANTDDIDQLQYLGVTTYKDHFADLWSDSGIDDYLDQYFSSDALRHSLNNPHCTWLLFKEDEKSEACGFAQMNWQRNTPLGNHCGAELQKIYFLASATGKGLGQLAFTAIENLARSKNEALIWLDVLHSNTQAQAFYRRRGFAVIGNIDFATDIKEVGYVVMLKTLR